MKLLMSLTVMMIMSASAFAVCTPETVGKCDVAAECAALNPAGGVAKYSHNAGTKTCIKVEAKQAETVCPNAKDGNRTATGAVIGAGAEDAGATKVHGNQ